MFSNSDFITKQMIIKEKKYSTSIDEANLKQVGGTVLHHIYCTLMFAKPT